MRAGAPLRMGAAALLSIYRVIARAAIALPRVAPSRLLVEERRRIGRTGHAARARLCRADNDVVCATEHTVGYGTRSRAAGQIVRERSKPPAMLEELTAGSTKCTLPFAVLTYMAGPAPHQRRRAARSRQDREPACSTRYHQLRSASLLADERSPSTSSANERCPIGELG